MKFEDLKRIKIVDDKVVDKEIDEGIEIEEIPRNMFFDVTVIKINISKDTTLKLEFSTRKATKLDVKITVKEGIHLNLMEYRFGKNFKVRYQYNLEKDSYTNIVKFYDVNGIKEMNMIFLNGENAKIDYNFKTISTGFEKYNLTIHHNAPKTISNICNNGVNINDGNLQFNVSSFGTLDNKGCIINQNSRIINLTNNKCGINPNLFIDEMDVEASHSALIGGFTKDEIFYLTSRGLSKKDAIMLLITGFLLNNTNELIAKKIKKNINKYWR